MGFCRCDCLLSQWLQSCPILCDSMDWWTVARQAPPSMGIPQARILVWVAFSFSRGFSQPRDGTQPSCIAGRFFYHLSHHFPVMITYTSTIQNNSFFPLFPFVNFWPTFRWWLCWWLLLFFRGFLGFSILKIGLYSLENFPSISSQAICAHTRGVGGGTDGYTSFFVNTFISLWLLIFLWK